MTFGSWPRDRILVPGDGARLRIPMPPPLRDDLARLGKGGPFSSARAGGTTWELVR
jgi:hypothetical protein